MTLPRAQPSVKAKLAARKAFREAHHPDVVFYGRDEELDAAIEAAYAVDGVSLPRAQPSRIEALYEALLWIVNVQHGQGRAGHDPEAGEYEAALQAGMDALVGGKPAVDGVSLSSPPEPEVPEVTTGVEFLLKTLEALAKKPYGKETIGPYAAAELVDYVNALRASLPREPQPAPQTKVWTYKPMAIQVVHEPVSLCEKIGAHWPCDAVDIPGVSSRTACPKCGNTGPGWHFQSLTCTACGYDDLTTSLSPPPEPEVPEVTTGVEFLLKTLEALAKKPYGKETIGPYAAAELVDYVNALRASLPREPQPADVWTRRDRGPGIIRAVVRTTTSPLAFRVRSNRGSGGDCAAAGVRATAANRGGGGKMPRLRDATEWSVRQRIPAWVGGWTRITQPCIKRTVPTPQGVGGATTRHQGGAGASHRSGSSGT